MAELLSKTKDQLVNLEHWNTDMKRRTRKKSRRGVTHKATRRQLRSKRQGRATMVASLKKKECREWCHMLLESISKLSWLLMRKSQAPLPVSRKSKGTALLKKIRLSAHRRKRSEGWGAIANLSLGIAPLNLIMRDKFKRRWVQSGTKIRLFRISSTTFR